MKNIVKASIAFSMLALSLLAFNPTVQAAEANTLLFTPPFSGLQCPTGCSSCCQAQPVAAPCCPMTTIWQRPASCRTCPSSCPVVAPSTCCPQQQIGYPQQPVYYNPSVQVAPNYYYPIH